MSGQAVQPQGIEAILSALQAGGQPNGNIGKLPSAVNPAVVSGQIPKAAGSVPQQQVIPGQAQGAVDPNAAAMLEANPQLLQAVLQALASSGAFNQPNPTGQS